jgi:Kef-type K+ transport system membrane component KefB
MDIALVIGIMIIAGFLGGVVMRKLRFPRVTGYIVVGILLSPSVLGSLGLDFLSKATVDSLDIITNVALGIIAYAIGSSLRLGSLRKLGRSIAWITPFQSLGTWLIVTLVLAFLSPLVLVIPGATFFQFYFPMALIIGAIASATAPALTLAILHELRARGPLTTILLAVVALDDAIAVIAFAIAVGVAQSLVSGVGGVSFYQMLTVPFLHILESVGIGAAFGFALINIAKLVKTRKLVLVVVLGVVVTCIGVTNLLGVSLIMANMVVGFVVANWGRKDEPFPVIENIEDVVFTMFFVLAGMHFDLGVMKTIGILAVSLFAVRFAGKYYGARIGAKIAHAPEAVKKYLGFALLPQAGVAIGLALLAQSAFPDFPVLGDVLLNAVLASVIISEIVSPPLVKYGITKAGEAAGSVKPVPKA